MFGDVVKNLRISFNLNQIQLAQKLSVSKQTVSNWEHNNILPSIDMLIKIADFFSVSTDFLLERDSKIYIEVTGLPAEHRAHVQQLINDLIENKKK